MFIVQKNKDNSKKLQICLKPPVPNRVKVAQIALSKYDTKTQPSRTEAQLRRMFFFFTLNLWNDYIYSKIYHLMNLQF